MKDAVCFQTHLAAAAKEKTSVEGVGADEDRRAEEKAMWPLFPLLPPPPAADRGPVPSSEMLGGWHLFTFLLNPWLGSLNIPLTLQGSLAMFSTLKRLRNPTPHGKVARAIQTSVLYPIRAALTS